MQKLTTNTITGYDRLIVSGRLAARRQWQLLKAALLIVDGLAIVFALMVAYKVRIDGWLLGLEYTHSIDLSYYRWIVFASVPIFWSAATLLGLYRRDNLLGGVIEYKQVIKACSASIFAIILSTFLIRDDNFDLSRGWIILAWMLSMGILLLARFVMRRIGYALREKNYLCARVLIVGANDQGAAIARQWRMSPRSGMRVLGFVDDFKSLGAKVVDDLVVIGRPTALTAVVHEYQVDEVVLVSSAVSWETFGELVTGHQRPDAFTMRLSPGFYELLTSSMAVTNKTFVPLLTLHESRIVGVDAAIKTLFDYTLTLIAFLATWPLAVLIALRLRQKHPGHAALTHTPAQGLLGKPFNLLQFDTFGAQERHRVGADIRSLEAWLVWTGVDKWPQLLNVLRGELSLVGPRPLGPDAQIAAMHGAHNLTSVKPGVLGPWLVHDALRSSDLLNDEVSYVRNWEIWRDIPIVLHAMHTHIQRLLNYFSK